MRHETRWPILALCACAVAVVLAGVLYLAIGAWMFLVQPVVLTGLLLAWVAWRGPEHGEEFCLILRYKARVWHFHWPRRAIISCTRSAGTPMGNPDRGEKGDTEGD